MPLLDMQRRGQQVGRIRIGVQVKTDKGRMRPEKLEHFRFTTQSRIAAEAVAELYGGTVRDWNGEHEVITKQSAIGVTVPPRDQVISQWYEMWTKGGCQRRCDSVAEQISGGACLCPQPADGSPEAAEKAAIERSRLASLSPPQACKRVTRLSVMIPDLPSLGVWRLDTGSFYAAAEIGDTAEILQFARDQGIFLPAVLRIEQRSRVADGQTKKFPVPVLEISATLRQITSGALEAGGITAQLPPPPGEQPKAITAGTQNLPGPYAPGALARSAFPDARAGEPEPWERATAVYRLAQAATTRAQVEALAAAAKDDGLSDEPVCIDQAQDEWQDLNSVLQDLWRERAA